MRLLLVRHGQSVWNAGRRLQGQADIPLSDLGRAQARRLQPVLAALAPDRAVSSDLSRAAETAELLGLGAELRPGLREIAVGGWQGEEIAAIIAREEANYRGWRAGSHAPAGGESWGAFRTRVVEAIAAEIAAGVTHSLVAVCHGGVIRALVEHYLGLSPSQIIPVGPASLTVLRFSEPAAAAARLELFNYRPDLPDLAAPD